MRLVLLLALSLLAGLPAQAGTTSRLSGTPVFAIDGQAHSAPSHQIVATPDEAHVITASHDRSIRIWDVDSGRLLRRLFVPLSGADDGRIEALAISPDGQYLAVGGELNGFASDAVEDKGDVPAFFVRQRAVLVFTLQDGRIHRVLAGLTSRATSLAWSPDGRFLALGLGSGIDQGVRVYSTASWNPVFEQQDFVGDIVSLQFRRDNALVAIGRGFVEGRPIANHAFLFRPVAPEGFGPAAYQKLAAAWAPRARWRPDGEAILAGPEHLLAAQGLRELPLGLSGTLQKLGFADRDIRETRFAADGVGVIGASYIRNKPTGWMRRWSDTAGSAGRDFPIPDPRVADFVVLKSGGIVYLSEDGAIAALSPEMELRWRRAAPFSALAGGNGSLRVSADGNWISLPVDSKKGSAALAFHLGEARFAPEESIGGQWHSPRESNGHLTTVAWRHGSEATVLRQGSEPVVRRSARFPLLGQELPLALAVHPREAALVFGTSEGRVKKITDYGVVGLLWTRELGSEVVGVNVIDSRGLVAVATADGFLRLLRWQDGEPVLTYYLNPAERRWLAVADSGHYVAGIGAEDGAGWIVNRDASQAADFFPLSRFRQEYLLPGLIRQALAAASERQGVRAALAEKEAQASPPDGSGPPVQPVIPAVPAMTRRPPVVDILSPGFEVTVREPSLRLRFRIDTPKDAPVTVFSARTVTQGSAARTPVAAPAGEQEQEITVSLPEEDSEIRLVAENRWGASTPATIRVRYAGARTRDSRGTLYILAAGVSTYDNPNYRLGFAAKDARDFVATLAGQERGRLYQRVVAKVLTDKSASKAEVEKGFAWLRQQVAPQDTAMVFLAGHGINDGRGDYFFLPRDADLGKLKETGVTFRLIRSSLASLPGRTLMFIDTCHSGNVLGKAGEGRSRDHTAAVNELASSENNIVVFASSTGSQYSQENDAWGNGAFTLALVEGLRGEADLKRRGRVTYKQLDAFVSDRVDELTQGSQTPVTPVLQGIADFVIAEVIRELQPRSRPGK